MNSIIKLLIITGLILINPILCAQNLLINSDFELGNGEFPDSWEKVVWDQSPAVTECFWVSEGAQSGKRCLFINGHEKNDARFIQAVKIGGNKKYKFSCWVKTENVSQNGTGANLSLIDEMATSQRIYGTNKDWMQINLYIDNSKSEMILKLALCLGGYSEISSGKVWFDNATLEEVTSIPDGAFIFNTRETIQKVTSIEPVKPRVNYTVIIVIIVFVICITGIFLLVLFFIKRADKIDKQDVPADDEKTDSTINLDDQPPTDHRKENQEHDKEIEKEDTDDTTS